MVSEDLIKIWSSSSTSPSTNQVFPLTPVHLPMWNYVNKNLFLLVVCHLGFIKAEELFRLQAASAAPWHTKWITVKSGSSLLSGPAGKQQQKTDNRAKPLFTNCRKSTTRTSQPHSALSASLNYLMSSCLQHTDTQANGKEWVMCRRRLENEMWCGLWSKSWILSFITSWCEWAVTVLMALWAKKPRTWWGCSHRRVTDVVTGCQADWEIEASWIIQSLCEPDCTLQLIHILIPES